MKMDEVLYSIAEKVKNFAVIYLVDITEVPDFNKMYVYFLQVLFFYVFMYMLFNDIFVFAGTNCMIRVRLCSFSETNIS